jgi:hypothetical protein
VNVDIAVIVTCHEPYRRWLPDALASLEQQVPAAAEQVVVFDGCKPSASISNSWRCITGEWMHPSGARNAGLRATSAPWLVFWDADNVMPDGYISAVRQAIDRVSAEVGIIYPDILYCDEQLRPVKLWQMPEWDYWALRQQNCVDSSSAWRREAIEIAGGWPLGERHEDYALALSITASAWKAVRLNGPAIVMREHGDNERWQRKHHPLPGIWQARSLGIASLLAGRASTLERWKRFLLTAELPPKTGLYVVDNSGDPHFRQRVYEACLLISSQRKLSHFDIAVRGRPYKSSADEAYMTRARHAHVAQLYAATLPRITEDLILTLEDDVEPPPYAIRMLGEQIGYPSRGKIGVVAAAYQSPAAPGRVCAGWGTEGWGRAIAWQALPAEPIDVASVGGGCSLWANWALRDCVAHVQWHLMLGWDGVLCSALRAKGYRVQLHGGVRCEHHFHGRVQGDAHPATSAAPAAMPSPRRPPPAWQDAANQEMDAVPRLITALAPVPGQRR